MTKQIAMTHKFHDTKMVVNEYTARTFFHHDPQYFDLTELDNDQLDTLRSLMALHYRANSRFAMWVMEIKQARKQ